MQVTSEYCASLVRQIEEKYAFSLRVRDVFLRVPRHAFLSPVDGVVSEQWLHEVYQDQAITTKRDERGMPLSSSSQPSVMALMLGALDIQPGQRVLEIGTGTGYNAVLLAHLTGDPALVTTIDIDGTLVESAHSRIASVVGEGMTLMVGDGRLGVPEHAPYERIIATASAFPVPLAWITQLAPGGRLVLDLRGKIGGALAMFVKQEDGTARGRFLDVGRSISFMGLRKSAEGDGRAGRFALPLLEEQTLYEPGTVEYACAAHFSTYEQFRGVDEAFNIWAQWLLPLGSIKWMSYEQRTFALLSDGSTREAIAIEARESQIGVAVQRNSIVWSVLVRAYEEWLEMGKPGRESYTLAVDGDVQEARVDQQEKSSILALAC